MKSLNPAMVRSDLLVELALVAPTDPAAVAAAAGNPNHLARNVPTVLHVLIVRNLSQSLNPIIV